MAPCFIDDSPATMPPMPPTPDTGDEGPMTGEACWVDLVHALFWGAFVCTSTRGPEKLARRRRSISSLGGDATLRPCCMCWFFSCKRYIYIPPEPLRETNHRVRAPRGFTRSSSLPACRRVRARSVRGPATAQKTIPNVRFPPSARPPETLTHPRQET